MDDKNIEYIKGYKDAEFDIKHDYDFFEKVIDSYLVVKQDIKDMDHIERHDFLTLIINKFNSLN